MEDEVCSSIESSCVVLHSAFDNLQRDLISEVVGYLNPIDLKRFEIVSKLMYLVASSAWTAVKSSNQINWLTVSKREDFSTKEYSLRCWLSRSKESMVGKFIVFGGDRDFNYSFNDDTVSPAFKLSSSTSSYGELYGVSTTVDKYGDLIIIGGWDSKEEETFQDVLRLKRSSSFGEGSYCDSWICSPEIRLPFERSFLSAYSSCCTGISGDLFFTGGGTSAYKGAEVCNALSIYRGGDIGWIAGPPMLYRRCGHASSLDINGNIIIAGGYGGGNIYHNTAEMLDIGSERWIRLPDLPASASGLGMGLSPQQSIQIIGGSTDGTLGLNTNHEFDLREGVWRQLSPMQRRRGYCGASFGASGSFYVSGGYHRGRPLGGIEWYDRAANKWSFLRVDRGEDSMTDVFSDNLETLTVRYFHQMKYLLG